MGHAAKTPPASVLEEAAEKMLAVLEEHVSKLPADKQQEKWDGLEAYVKSAASGTRAKRRAPRATKSQPYHSH